MSPPIPTKPGVFVLLGESLRSSVSSALLIVKLVVPLYILADILLYFDLLRHLSGPFRPVTSILQLPVEAAAALAGGVLINIYAAIAFAAPLGLDPLQWTVLAVFLGVCHSMLIECAILGKLGMTYGYSILLRLSMAFVTVWPLRWLPSSWFIETSSAPQPVTHQAESVLGMLSGAVTGALVLSVKIILLVAALIVILDLVKAAPTVQRYTQKVSTAFSLIAGQLLGITYGAGILLREATLGNLTRKDILFIGTFLSICHSIIEDVLLFVLFGANFWVVVVLRFTAAIGASVVFMLLFQYVVPMRWAVRQ